MTPGHSDVEDGSLRVEFVALPPLDVLEREWRDLEERSDCSFFVSWSWIGCWARLLGASLELRLLRAVRSERTVGLGLLARRRERRHGLILSDRWHLNSTGDEQFDCIYIECNGFLVERQTGERVVHRMLDQLAAVDGSWDEVVLDGLWRVPSWPSACVRNPRRAVLTRPNHYIDLAEVRTRGGYLELLGPKTRAVIRRSGREYAKLGPLSVRAAADFGEASAYLVALKALHQSYWSARGKPGAFASPFFEQFHQRLLSSSFARGEIQLLGVFAGSRALGYIYNFVHRARVYSYQSGFDYGVCERHNRPGLVSHACAIEFNAARGNTLYDLLGGDVEYKSALGTRVAEMSWVVLQRSRWRFTLEDAMRTARRWLAGRRSLAPPAASQAP